ncbi:TetR family transcriptional regulator [Methanocella paludicola SANAE]|uniref:TetR family transcriptional regulator n=1 Tax=Methanocella paludicola (strain DSM 17711 / JCM 13418 / NBRC 101707 / SANAE) TaxID=304371 RepID=D1YWR7_METPS|nr:TetR/AcrR family transcriptional regulator [Methanocella paludicola]BAI60889.1 TetR family transcriptional regulator [Methanocella paludicola SANAE]
MSERMERKKRQKRNTIIDKAERIMAKKGYWDMTMDDVAADADVAKGTIYLYFNSKESLCAAVVARIIADMNLAIKENLEGVEGGTARIVATATAVTEWNMSHPDKGSVLENAIMLKFKDVSDPNVREYVSQMSEQLQIMSDGYRMAIAEGSVRPDLDPLPTAIFLRMAYWVAMNPFRSHELIMQENGVDREALLNTAIDLIYHATHTDAKKHSSIKIKDINTRQRKAKAS